MEEPGKLPSMGSHRIGHDWSDLAAATAADLLGERKLHSHQFKEKINQHLRYYQVFFAPDAILPLQIDPKQSQGCCGFPSGQRAGCFITQWMPRGHVSWRAATMPFVSVKKLKLARSWFKTHWFLSWNLDFWWPWKPQADTFMSVMCDLYFNVVSN